MVILWLSMVCYGYPMVIIWLSYGYPMSCYGYPMVIIWLSYGYPCGIWLSYGYHMVIIWLSGAQPTYYRASTQILQGPTHTLQDVNHAICTTHVDSCMVFLMVILWLSYGYPMVITGFVHGYYATNSARVSSIQLCCAVY